MKIGDYLSIAFTLGLLIAGICMLCTPGIELFPAIISFITVTAAFVYNLRHIWKSRK